MIELKDFVAESLNQIIDGVKLAQENAKEVGAKISSQRIKYYKGGEGLMWHEATGHPAHLFEYDVAVITSEADKVKGGIGVFVAGIGLGTQAKIEDVNSTVSRIKFSIPVIFPIQDE
jgi:hypothetical protein